MKKEPVHLLAFSPHPIDTEWGLGGTVARLTAEGKKVAYVVCTNGDKGTSDPSVKPEELAKTREAEQMAAAGILGVDEVVFLRHPDLGLEYTLEFRAQILRLLMEYRPEIVATCDPFRRYFSNRDHRVLGQIVLDSVWPTALAPNAYPELLQQGYELHKVREVLLWHTEDPNYSIDVTEYWDTKMSAFGCHKSQIGDPVGAEFLELIEGYARAAAEGKGFKRGEAFHRLDVLQRL